MKKVIIFGGTTEGKILAEELSEHRIFCLYCVATDYGRQQVEGSSYVRIRSGRMDGKEMLSLFREEIPDAIVDATHPFAQIVKEELDLALEEYGKIPFFRVLRDEENRMQEGCTYFASPEDCAAALERTKGRVLLTTGSKELSVFCQSPILRERVVARVIPGEESLRLCSENGLMGSQVIAMQGPFSTELNLAFIKETKAQILVMKEGGRSGGEAERIEAAKMAGIPCYIIQRPTEPWEGESLSEVREELFQLLAIPGEPQRVHVTLAGFGMGYGSLTEEVSSCIREADIVFGAPRMLCDQNLHKEKYPYYLAKDILPKLREIMDRKDAGPQKAVVLFSGDTGFYSGAKKLKEALEKEEWISVTILPGISSVSALAAKTGESWEDGILLSTHGAEERDWASRLLSSVTHHEKVFVITSGSQDVRKIGELLDELRTYKGFELTITAGVDLYGNECIQNLNPEQCRSFEEEGLCTLLIRNPSPKKKRLPPGLSDGEFERDQVPMSKEEVRALSICKLGVTENALCYDIGSGSGSVAVELGRLDPGMKVYAIECDPFACELTQRNIDGFGLKNVFLVKGKAPEALHGLPIPTHVFIGGSGGNLKEILETLIAYKKEIKVVVNAVTLETVARMQDLIQTYGFTQVDVVQLSVSKVKQVGDHHMLQGQNPVYITTFTIPKDLSIKGK